MQHILIVPNDDPAGAMAYPHEANVWRDDQGVMWILDEGLAWNNQEPPDGPGANQAIIFSEESGWVADGGLQPAPIGSMPEGPDTRFYAALGPGSTLQFKNYAYTFFVVDPLTGNPVPALRFVPSRPKPEPKQPDDPIDPDIANQPHP